MSFSILKAGPLNDVRQDVAEANVYDNKVGELAKEFIGQVLALSESKGMIVEASGHSGREAGGHVNVSITIRPVL